MDLKSPSAIYGGMDGVISTLTMVMAGSAAELTPSAILSVGIAKIIADAYSMAVGKYTSEPGMEREAAETFMAFVLAGVVPMSPYIFGVGSNSPVIAIILSMAVFLYLGEYKGLTLGSSAAALSYTVAKNI